MMSEDLLTKYRFSASSMSATRVLLLCDDPHSSVEEMARVISSDPLLSAKVLRVANSAYYGLSGRVSKLEFAVSVIGVRGLRSIAVLSISGLNSSSEVPENFWQAAALCATGAELIAPILDADPGDAFIAGLLHLIGSALMHQHGQRVSLCLPVDPNESLHQTQEREQFGISHDDLAATAMQSWHLPSRIFHVVARHHLPMTPGALPLERALYIARLLTSEVLCPPVAEDPGYTWISEGRITAAQGEILRDRMTDRAAALLDGLLGD